VFALCGVRPAGPPSINACPHLRLRPPAAAVDPADPAAAAAAPRLAPLSEGRVEGGQLECSYHGWRFDGAGRCTRIPQSLDAKAEATACASGRSCVTAYPLKEYAGVIWVWGDASPGAAAEAGEATT
jgi:nitrite reductase/ring-hydroxylating ferredoxin subunit